MGTTSRLIRQGTVKHGEVGTSRIGNGKTS